jgi:hypothetical protein
VEQSAFPKCRLIIEEIPTSGELQVSALELAQ